MGLCQGVGGRLVRDARQDERHLHAPLRGKFQGRFQLAVQDQVGRHNVDIPLGPVQNVDVHHLPHLVIVQGAIAVGQHKAGRFLRRDFDPLCDRPITVVIEIAAGYAMMFLEQRIQGLGGKILYGTEATELITDANGKVTGVKAKAGDGASWTLTGKAVLLASGGFMRNAEMIKQYYPEYEGQFFNCASASTGDGIKMGLAVGAYMECTGRALPAYLSTDASKFEIALIHHSTPGIMVNARGENFGNIVSDNHYKMAAAKLALKENGGAYYYVFDDAAACSNSDFEGYGMNTYKAIFEKGEAVKYGSVAEAVEKLGLTNLQASIDANNAAALAGEADAFGRKNCPYIETRNGLWILKVDPTFYLTTGGLAIDTATHVLKEDGSTIPGLYAAGDVTGSIEEKDGKKYGMGFDAALAYGYIAGETIDAEV